MKFHLTLALTLAVALMQGCATVAVERAKDLSSAAIQYSQATVAVIDVAIDAAIDADSEALVRAAPRAPVVDAERQTKRRDDLEKLNAGLAKSVSLYSSLKHSVNTIKAYFIALQELANGSPAEAAGEAVKLVAQRVNGLNKALEGSSAVPKLNDAQIAAVGGLAKLVVAQVHGAAVARAIERDAAIIGRALVLQQSVLKLAGDDIRSNLNDANGRFFVDRVGDPYERGVIGAAWVNDRRAYLKVRALGQTDAALTAAETTAGQMQTVWERILSGVYSAKEITAMLKDTEDLLDAVNALKTAGKTK
jgi:hypothetical protein